MNQGSTNPLILPLVIVSVLLLGSLGFGFWAFSGRQDYKNNVDAKIADATEIAEENLTIKKDAEFAESYKLPNTIYKGPDALGTLTITYPKTWSNFVDLRPGGVPLSGFMHPNYVPANDDDINIALRYEVLERQYDQEVKSFDSKVRQGRAKVSAFRLPKMKSELGVRIEGEIESQKQGVMVLLKLRDKTIRVWTEGDEFRNDFESILNQLTFSP